MHLGGWLVTGTLVIVGISFLVATAKVRRVGTIRWECKSLIEGLLALLFYGLLPDKQPNGDYLIRRSEQPGLFRSILAVSFIVGWGALASAGLYLYKYWR